MSTNPVITQALLKQLDWLKTWKTKDHGYNGYVVHRHDLKRMYKLHDTPWSQGPIIQGYLNLYRKTKQGKWLEEAIHASDLQCKRLDKSGKYIYAGFEDDRFSSLVHNSLANCALLDLAAVLIAEGKNNVADKYILAVRQNIDRYIIGKLWDENFGAFKFSEIDFYSPNATRFVTNMNSVAAESLIALSGLTGDNHYNQYARRVGEWLLLEQIKSKDIRNGGISYSHIQPGILISIYTALAMRGIPGLYSLTQDDKYREMMKNGAGHLISLIDPETGLFYHAIIEGKLDKYPQFIAGAGIILKALDDAERLTGIKYDYQATVKAILDKQLDNGGFSNFIHYRNLPGKYVGRRNFESWEDHVPVTGWNAHLFEYFTRMVTNDFIYQPAVNTPTWVANRNYLYREGNNSVFIWGLRPKNGWIFFFAVKRNKTAVLYFSLAVLSKVKNILSKLIRSGK